MNNTDWKRLAAYQAGVNGAALDLDHYRNPHSAGSMEFLSWRQGWDDYRRWLADVRGNPLRNGIDAD